MSLRFLHETHDQRVVFATGGAAEALAEEVSRLGASAVMVVAGSSSTGAAAHVTAGLPVVHRHHDVVMHVPAEVAERARRDAVDHGCDAVVSVGGGSATGLAKVVALATGLPVVAVPTTYSGSETTPVWGLTEGTTKRTGTDPRVLPRSVVYDASLTLSLPRDAGVASGMNALAHCVDALWAPRAGPVNALLATEGVRSWVAALPRLVDDPEDLEGREQALYAAYLSGVAFASAGSGLHHKICHVLGGRYRLPHAATHAVVLPHVLALNAPHAPRAAQRLAEALGSSTALRGLLALSRRVGAPHALRDLGLDAPDLPRAADAVLAEAPPGNPAPLTRDVLERLLHAAWAGSDPRDD